VAAVARGRGCRRRMRAKLSRLATQRALRHAGREGRLAAAAARYWGLPLPGALPGAQPGHHDEDEEEGEGGEGGEEGEEEQWTRPTLQELQELRRRRGGCSYPALARALQCDYRALGTSDAAFAERCAAVRLQARWQGVRGRRAAALAGWQLRAQCTSLRVRHHAAWVVQDHWRQWRRQAGRGCCLGPAAVKGVGAQAKQGRQATSSAPEMMMRMR
jgi:hypothetical protein